MKVGNIHVYDVRERYPSGYAHRDLDQITNISIHHSVSRTMPFFSSPSEEVKELDLIHAYHKGKYKGIAYPLVVFPSGSQYCTGDWDTIRYVVGGNGNVHTLSILAHGTFTDSTPDALHLLSLQELIDNVRYELGSNLPLYGHKDIAAEPTACPGNTWPNWGLH